MSALPTWADTPQGRALLQRIVASDPDRLHRIFDGHPDLYAIFRPTAEKPSLFDGISDALNSDFWFGAYAGFVGGCLFTVLAAFVWGMFL